MDVFLWCKAGLWSSHFPVCPLAPIPSVLPYICFCSCRMNWSRLKLRLRNQSRLKLPFFSQDQPFPQNPQRTTEGRHKQYKNRTSSSHTSLEYCPSFQHFPTPEEVSAVFTFRSVPNSTELLFHGEQNQKSLRVTQRWHWEGIIATRGK